MIYELAQKHVPSKQQIPLSQVLKTWQLHNEKEQFTLEKCLLYLLQILRIMARLESLNVFSYLDLTLDNLVVETESQRIYLNSDLTHSFKL